MKVELLEAARLYPEWHDFGWLLGTFGKFGYLCLSGKQPEYVFTHQFSPACAPARLNHELFRNCTTASAKLMGIAECVERWWSGFSRGMEMQGLFLFGSNAKGTWRDEALAQQYRPLISRLQQGEQVSYEQVQKLPFTDPRLEELLQGESELRGADIQAVAQKLSKPSDIDLLMVSPGLKFNMPERTVLTEYGKVEMLPGSDGSKGSSGILKATFRKPAAPAEIHVVIYTGEKQIVHDEKTAVFDVLNGKWYNASNCKPDDAVRI